MKMLLGLGVAALVIAIAPAALAAEKLTEIDASGGKAKDQWVVILSQPTGAGAPQGTAVVAVGTGDKFDAGFGLNMAAGKQVASAIKEDVVKTARTADKGPETTTLKAKVSAEQYAAVKKLIDAWSAKKSFDDGPADVSVNFVQDVVKALGLKPAYRSGLGGLNPVRYYADLSTINRKVGQKPA